MLPLGITLASLGLGWGGELALAHLLEPVIRLFPGEVQSELSHHNAAGLAFTFITFLHVVVGELATISIALQSPEATAHWVAYQAPKSGRHDFNGATERLRLEILSPDHEGCYLDITLRKPGDEVRKFIVDGLDMLQKCARKKIDAG